METLIFILLNWLSFRILLCVEFDSMPFLIIVGYIFLRRRYYSMNNIPDNINGRKTYNNLTSNLENFSHYTKQTTWVTWAISILYGKTEVSIDIPYKSLSSFYTNKVHFINENGTK